MMKKAAHSSILARSRDDGHQDMLANLAIHCAVARS
jgi:hypothetical protein